MKLHTVGRCDRCEQCGRCGVSTESKTVQNRVDHHPCIDHVASWEGNADSALDSLGRPLPQSACLPEVLRNNSIWRPLKNGRHQPRLVAIYHVVTWIITTVPSPFIFLFPWNSSSRTGVALSAPPAGCRVILTILSPGNMPGSNDFASFSCGQNVYLSSVLNFLR